MDEFPNSKILWCSWFHYLFALTFSDILYSSLQILLVGFVCERNNIRLFKIRYWLSILYRCGCVLNKCSKSFVQYRSLITTIFEACNPNANLVSLTAQFFNSLGILIEITSCESEFEDMIWGSFDYVWMVLVLQSNYAVSDENRWVEERKTIIETRDGDSSPWTRTRVGLESWSCWTRTRTRVLPIWTRTWTRDMRTRTRLGLGPSGLDRTRQTAQIRIDSRLLNH